MKKITPRNIRWIGSVGGDPHNPFPLKRHSIHTKKLPRRNAKGQYSSIRPVIFFILCAFVILFLILNKLLNAPLTSPCPETGCFVSQVVANEGRFTRDTDPVIKAIHINFDQISYDVGDEAVQIAMCESSLNPQAIHINTNGSVDRGLFQINSVHRYTAEQLLDLDTNVKIAVKIYKKQGWKPWVCRKIL